MPPKKGSKASTETAELVPVTRSYLAQSDFYKELTPNKKKRLSEIDDKFHEDTNNELSDVDYYNLATLQYMIESLDKAIEKVGGPDMAEPELITDQRKAKETVIGILQKWRDNKRTANSSLGSLQEAILKMRGPSGSMFSVEIKKDQGEVLNLDEALVIDVPHKEVIPDGTN